MSLRALALLGVRSSERRRSLELACTLARRCSAGHDHATVPTSQLEYLDEQADAPGYPSLSLWNCACGGTIARAKPGRCDRCNELLHDGASCEDVASGRAVAA